MELDEGLVIGDYPCDFNTILTSMQQSDSYSSLHSKWSDLARALNVDSTDFKRLQRSLILELRTLNDVLDEILRIWRAAADKQATLKIFCEALQKCDLRDIADVLQNEFGRPAIIQFEEKTGIPTLPKYYILRTLCLPTKLKLEVFQTKARDVFVLSGMEWHQLTLLANGTSTDRSGNQRKGVTVRFILLDLDDHVKDIFTVSSSPVHLIEKRDDSFHWISSSGSRELIRKYTDPEEGTQYTESNFVDKVFGEFNSTPISIADTPGMGKSLLLASIAQQTKTKFAERHVALCVLTEFIKMSFDIQVESLKETQKWIHSIISCCHGDNCRLNIELFLDGYDEILLDQLDQAKILFNTLKKLRNLRFAVTTRPHMKNELETTLGVLSCSISPFSVDNQIQFLREFWMNNHDAHDCPELTNFSSELLSKFHDRRLMKERNIAGVPLLCSMLAEVYSDDAVCCSYLERRVEIQVNSIFSVFDRLIRKKLHENPRLARSVSKSLKQDIVDRHIYEAFKLIFPQYKSVVPAKQNSVSEQQMYAVGLLEFNSLTSSPHFAHRTFAEFLVADIIVQNMSNSAKFAALFVRAVETSATLTSKDITYLVDSKIEYYRFKYPVIGYFINGQLEKPGLTLDYIKIKKTLETQDNSFAYKILTASVVDNLTCCFQLALNTAPKFQLNDWQLSNLLNLAAYYRSSIDIFNQILQRVTKMEIRRAKLKEVLHKPLLIAAHVGYYTYVDTLLNLVNNPKDYLKDNYFLIVCLSQSASHSKEMVEEKILILKLVYSIDSELAKREDDEDNPPLLQHNVHPRLLMYLLEVGANPNVYHNFGGTVLHAFFQEHEWDKISPKLFTEFYDCLVERGFKLFNKTDIYRRTPLFPVVENVEVEDRVLDSFKSHGANFNARDCFGFSVLFYAIRGGRSARFIDRLINQHGCTLNSNKKGKSPLHIAAEYGNLEVIRYLVQANKCNINGLDKEGKTPLHAAQEGWSKNKSLIVDFLMESGAVFFPVSSQGP